MERILVFSDTHGNTQRVQKIISDMMGVTAVIHLGDIERDINFLMKEFDKIPFYAVRGNNDYFSSMPTEQIVKIGNFNIFITHGHRYVSGFSNIDRLVYRGIEEKATIVLYGHTHVRAYEEIDGIIYANPGSISYPRGEEPSYGVIEIENGKLAYANIPVGY